MTTAATLMDFPKETRREVLDRLPLRDCFRLPLVCKLLVGEVDNDFFRARCLAHFQELSELANFLDPFVASVEKPWAWIAYSLGCVCINRELLPIAAKLARASETKFTAYAAKQKGELQASQDKLKGYLGLTSDKHKEVKAKLKEAMRAHEAWNSAAQEKALSLVKGVKSSDIASYNPLIQSASREISTRLLKEGVDPIEAEVRCHDPEALLAELKKIRDEKPLLDFAKLSLEGSRLLLAVKQLKMVNTFRKFLETFPELEKNPQLCSTGVFYHILCLLPHMRNWLPTFNAALKLHELLFLTMPNKQYLAVGQNPAGFLAMLDSAPEPIPEIIRRELSDKKGKTALEVPQEYIEDFKKLVKKDWDVFYILKRCLFKQPKADFNPMFNSLICAAITGLKKRDHLKIEFRYPAHDPDLGRVRGRLAAARPLVFEEFLMPVSKPPAPSEEAKETKEVKETKKDKEPKIIDEKGWDSDESSSSSD